MKNLTSKLLAMALILGAFAFTACSDDDEVKKWNVSVSLNLEDGLTASNLQNLQLTATNARGKAQVITLDANGNATTTLAQGVYTFSLSGDAVGDEIVDNATVTGLAEASVYADAAVKIDVNLVIPSTLIFKTLSHVGPYAYYVKASWFEIVNNSDEVQYLDNVILASSLAGQSQPNAWQAAGITDKYPMGNGAAVLAFPGNGTDYPLQPGESIIVASDACNHRDSTGNELAPDLSNADWEVYLDYNSQEVDNPAPNLKWIFTNNRYMAIWGLGVISRCYMLAKLPDGVTPEAFIADPANLSTTPGTTSTTQYVMIPSAYVLDAVDVWNASSTEHYGFFLPKDDKQGVLCSDMYSGKVERRKVAKIVNGRKYYKDTNNSAEDFLNNQDPNEE